MIPAPTLNSKMIKKDIYGAVTTFQLKSLVFIVTVPFHPYNKAARQVASCLPCYR